VYSQVQDLGGSLIAISPQLSKYSKQVAKKHNLTYPVLTDKNNELAKKLNITFPFPKKLKELYSGGGVDLARFNGDDSWVMPMSGRFIIDTKGVIRSTEVHPDYTIRPEPAETVALMESIL
jgi:peroxiredoxin